MTYNVTPPTTAEKGKMRVTAQFYKIERDLYRAGAEAYNEMVYATLDHKLEEAGGIGPFVHSELERDGNVSPYVLVSEEA